MQTKKGPVSSASCSSDASGSYVSLKGRIRKTAANRRACNSSAIAFKKRKLNINNSGNPPKYLTVNVSDVLQNDNLCSKYDVQQKTGDESNDAMTIGSVGSSSLTQSHTESDSLSGTASVDEDDMSEDRRVVMQDNFMITVTRTVTAQKEQVNNNKFFVNDDNYSSNSSSTSTDWDAWLTENTKNCRKTWQKEYSLAENEIYKITSCDAIFTNAKLHDDVDVNIGDNVFATSQLGDGVANIKVQIANNRASNESTCSSASSFNSSNGSQIFKMPLPPAKRPPSRPRKTIIFSSSSDTHSLSTAASSANFSEESKSSMKDIGDDDDALSITASTVLDVEQPNSNFDESASEYSHQAETVNSFDPIPFSSSQFEIAAKNDDIKRWIQNSSPLRAERPPSPLIETEASCINSDNCMYTSDAETYYKPARRSIPRVFTKMRLCASYFMNNSTCRRRPPCNYSHDVSSIDENAIFSLNPVELREAYKWALTSKLLFQHTFKAFVKKFSRQKGITELISMVDDIFMLDLFDRTPYIQQLVFALQNADFTFRGAIETLICNHGLKYVCLPDILLNLVIELEEDLKSNWNLIKEILKFKSGEIDFGVVNDIVSKIVKSGTKDLCVNICEDIFDKYVKNFENIDKDLLTDLLTLLYNHKLFEHYHNLKNKCNVLHAANGFSTRTSSLINGATSLLKRDQHEFKISKNSHSVSTNMQKETAVQTDSVDCCPPELDDNEIRDLLHSLRSENINLFVALLNKYKATDKVDSFALNTVVYLFKNHVDKQYFKLLKSLELVYPNFMKDLPLKAIIEQVSYNVLDFLTRQDMWSVAYQVLVRFEGTLDSFVRSREFRKTNLSERTLAERYLYICKIYIKNSQYKKAIKIFLRKDLSLLKSCSTWKVEYGSGTERYRNRIVLDLLQGVLSESDVRTARCVVHHVLESIQDGQMTTEIWTFYNNLIIHMLNKKDKYKIDIVDEFQKKIFTSWHKRLKGNVLRGLGATLLRLQAVKEKDSIEFYNTCCNRNVYPLYDGTESEIIMKTDLISEEVYLTLLTFFYKIAIFRHNPKNLKVSIECPEEIYNEPLILLNSDVGFTEMKKRVKDVLVKAFGVLVDETEISSIDRFVIIKQKFVVNCVRKLQNAYKAK